MKTSVIEVHDMLSVLSVDEVEKRIGQVPGVGSVTVNYAGGNATVRYDETRLAIGDVKSAVRESSYEPAAAPANADAPTSDSAAPAAAGAGPASAGSASADKTAPAKPSSSSATPAADAPPATPDAAKPDAGAPVASQAAPGADAKPDKAPPEKA